MRRVGVWLVACAALAASEPTAGVRAESMTPLPVPTEVGTPAGHPTSGTVPFVSQRPGQIVVPVSIGGFGPFHFLLDTGSTHSVIRDALRESLSLVPVARTSMSSTVGTVTCLVVRMDDVQMGAARVDGLLPTALPSSAMALLGADIDGVIGQDFLARFDYTIDYRESVVRWDDGDDDGTGVRLTLVPSHGRFLVELPQQLPGAAVVRLVPDSGADGVVLFEHAGALRLPVDGTGRSIRVGSLAGSGAGRAVVVRQLHVGSTRLQSQIAAVVPARAEVDEGDGLLPLDLFASVSFNNRQGYMQVEPR
jgi:predicted aspartyl protease